MRRAVAVVLETSDAEPKESEDVPFCRLKFMERPPSHMNETIIMPAAILAVRSSPILRGRSLASGRATTFADGSAFRAGFFRRSSSRSRKAFIANGARASSVVLVFHVKRAEGALPSRWQ